MKIKLKSEPDMTRLAVELVGSVMIVTLISLVAPFISSGLSTVLDHILIPFVGVTITIWSLWTNMVEGAVKHPKARAVFDIALCCVSCVLFILLALMLSIFGVAIITQCIAPNSALRIGLKGSNFSLILSAVLLIILAILFVAFSWKFFKVARCWIRQYKKASV